MDLKSIVAFLVGALLAVAGSWGSSILIEDRSRQLVHNRLLDTGNEWAEVTADGLLVTLGGQAPDEATRFRVVTLVGQVIDPDRVVDEMGVAASAALAPPEISIEMLRNGKDISLIGLVPASTNPEGISRTLSNIGDNEDMADLLETVEYEAPLTWENALRYAMDALRKLEKSKISVSPELVEITATVESVEEKRRVEADLSRRKPRDVRVALTISAPRPVITPFTFRMTLNDAGASFDACAVGSEDGRDKVLRAAAQVGISGKTSCEIGLGVPSNNWADAIVTAISGVQDLGGGTITFSDNDVSLVALETTAQPRFDRVVGELNASLPEEFSLHAVLPEPPATEGETGEAVIPEFVATRSPEGLVQLRGRLPDDGFTEIVNSFAKAKFGSEAVYVATRTDDGLPSNWPVRVLAALEGLALLENGSVTVQPEFLELRGVSGSQSAREDAARILADKLGNAVNFELSVRYDPKLDPANAIPTEKECLDTLNAILAANKIVFEPSSADIALSADDTMDAIAKQVRVCEHVEMEIGGHTDSQGREIMNLALSQDRAEAVITAIQNRRVRTRHLTAKGYGETIPIADNDTEEGREANRRIEFKLASEIAAEEEDAVAEDPSDENVEDSNEQN